MLHNIKEDICTENMHADYCTYSTGSDELILNARHYDNGQSTKHAHSVYYDHHN